MAPEADPAPEDDPEGGNPFTLARGLRFLEGLAFCCLAALVIAWASDRSRGIDFDPITVTLCDESTCADTPAENRDRVWSQFTNTLDLQGVVAFTQANVCVFAADVLQNRLTEEGAEQTLTLMQDRGTMGITRPGDGTATISPGRNNDGLGDILRDALRWQGTRGCHPMRYAALFWPLWTVWLLLISWRLLRYRQTVWAER